MVLRRYKALLIALPLLASCSTQTLSQPGTASAPRSDAAATATLLPNFMFRCQEASGAGLYSYLLTSHSGSRESKRHLIDLIGEILRKSRHLEQRLAGGEGERNVTFLPVWVEVPQWVLTVDDTDEEGLAAAARWVERYYDFDCAQRLLASVNAKADGMYFISTIRPLGQGEAGAKISLQLDMTEVEPAQWTHLLDEFHRRTWHRRDWTEPALFSVASLLKMRLTPAGSSVVDAAFPVTPHLQGKIYSDAPYKGDARESRPSTPSLVGALQSQDGSPITVKVLE